MKKLFLLFAVFIIYNNVYGSANIKPVVDLKPAVARIASYMQGIVDMKVTLGQHVKKGQLLFKISTDYTEIMKAKVNTCGIKRFLFLKSILKFFKFIKMFLLLKILGFYL